MGELKREIRGESGSVPTDRLIERPGGHPVDVCQVRVQDDLDTANRADALFQSDDIRAACVCHSRLGCRARGPARIIIEVDAYGNRLSAGRVVAGQLVES